MQALLLPVLIIQASFPRTASTLLVNALYGMIPELVYEPVVWSDFRQPLKPQLEQPIRVIKTHETRIDSLIDRYAASYDLYFVCSERRSTGHRIDTRLPNVAIIDYDELASGVPAEIVDRIYRRVMNVIGIATLLNRESGVRRVAAMNARYKEIADYPFDYVDPFYQLHGSHRQRSRLRGGGGPTYGNMLSSL